MAIMDRVQLNYELGIASSKLRHRNCFGEIFPPHAEAFDAGPYRLVTP